MEDLGYKVFNMDLGMYDHNTRMFTKDGIFVQEFRSIKEAAEYANIHYKASKSSLIKYYKFGNISIEKCND